ncbi:MAG: lycopene cyclase family protein [Chitinophagia bacterium]|jgi:lycopene beta-cyclase
MPLNKEYDYIITGGGCAGLSLVMRMLNEPHISTKRILIIDKDDKKKNDRTWCYWEKGTGFFDGIIYRKWEKAWFHGEDYSSLKPLGPYAYKMIRGIDFYQHCHGIIASSPNVELFLGEMTGIVNTGEGVKVEVGENVFHAKYVFNSILLSEPVLKKDQYQLLQHFKGWIIETKTPVFNTEEATLMDFRVSQEEGTTFVYVMPLSPTRALVEYTLFTEQLLMQEQYDNGLKHYIESFLKTNEFEVVEEEFGVIPMTDLVFPEVDGNIIHLGTAGGQTKPSSGYTFRFIQKKVDVIISRLASGLHPHQSESIINKRFKWFDQVLLHMLARKKMSGKHIFSLLFSRNRISTIFAFLDNETKILQELKLLNTLPQLPFMRAGWFELFKK